MDLQTTKILVAVLFGVIRFMFGILPLKLYICLRRWEEDDGSNTFINQKRHNQVNCGIIMCQSFGGGVLFATCFLHMMLQVYRSVEELKMFGHLQTEYPLSQLSISIGFFFVYFMEEISHWLIFKIPEDKPPIKKKVNNYTSVTVTPISEKVDATTVEDEYIKRVKKSEQEEVEEGETKLESEMNDDQVPFDSSSLSSEVVRENEKNLKMNDNLEVEKEVLECKEKLDCVRQQSMRCILFVVALSFHAIIEGLAIGLENNHSEIWYMFIATSIHSATILFCIGLELLMAKASIKWIFILMLILSLSSPLGVILGLLITIKSKIDTIAKCLATVLLEGLSAGTILYITFFEILNREKERRVRRLSRSCCIIAGFTMMAILQSLDN